MIDIIKYNASIVTYITTPHDMPQYQKQTANQNNIIFPYK